MKFEYEKKTNVKIGQKLYGIVAVSIYTYDGVYPITVDTIDYNYEEVIFKIDQPCKLVSCGFNEMEEFVFESREEADNKIGSLEFGVGLEVYNRFW